MKAFDPKARPGFVSLEGYLAAKIFVEGLTQVGGHPTRESLVDALQQLSGYDPGIGLTVQFSRHEHQASHTVWPTVVRKGRFFPLKWSELR